MSAVAEDAAGAADAPAEALPEPTPLLSPREGLPAVVSDEAALAQTVRAFAAGSGPVAVDAERASGYRYVPRAYLVQLRRAGAGTALIDPLGVPDLSALGVALADAEWVLHAASQDIPSLRGVGMAPPRVFDTELAGRLLGLPRVGLGPLVEAQLGFRLEKGHSAADWSTRPLPEPWLHYAALDVELLLELRDRLEAHLAAAGKLEWARQEFAYVAAMADPAPRSDPWRRTSGLHRVRDLRRQAVVRELWQERDAVAQERDIAPGRVLTDAAIIQAASAQPRSVPELEALPGFRGRGARRRSSRWAAAVGRALALPEAELPQPLGRDADVPPPSARQWPARDAAAAGRLAAVRAAVAELAERHTVPAENLVPPDAVRRLCWRPPDDLSEQSVAAELNGFGARPWQVELVAGPLCAALRQTKR